METFNLLVAVLLSLPPAHRDVETWREREVRMTTIATAVDDAANLATCHGYAPRRCEEQWYGSKRDLALLVLTQGWFESRFARNVQLGKCAPDECGGDARSVWQLERTSFAEPVWDDMAGIDYGSTFNAAWVATQILARSRSACGSVSGAVSLYATGSTCRWAGARKRVDFWRSLRAKCASKLHVTIERRRSLHHPRLFDPD